MEFYARVVAMAGITLMAVGMPFAAAMATTCPATAPSKWGLGDAKLDTVGVLSFPADDVIDDDVERWLMVPARQWKRRGQLVQTWNLNFDAPRYVFQVACGYVGTRRLLRIDADQVKTCTANWDFRHGKIVPGTVRINCDAGA